MERRRVRFGGRVQGVGFRATTRAIASSHPVSGWVRNEEDGDVLLEVQGDAAAVEAFLRALRERMAGKIVREDGSVTPVVEGEAGFSIRRKGATVLIFFDIDATLITTNRAGIAALALAGQELYRPDFVTDGISFGGGLDPILLGQLLEKNGVPVSAATMEEYRAAYGKHLESRLEDRSRCRALPGVMEIVAALRERDDVVLGLLTGNYAETGAMKLRACGIDPEWFPVKVWGDDSPHTPPDRAHLPPVGVERYRAHAGRAIEHHRVTVIGDTPNDVRCARAHGCRSLAVATGGYDMETLTKTGGDRVVKDLSDTPDILRWLVG